MVLDDPLTAIGVASIVFFFLLGALYLTGVKLAGRRWLGVVFLLIGGTILVWLLRQPGVSGITIATIAALVAKELLERRGIGGAAVTRTFAPRSER